MLTKDEILQIPAGSRMDAVIAEQIMGWHWLVYDKDYNWAKISETTGAWVDKNNHFFHNENWKPSIDVAYSWKVIETMQTSDTGNWFFSLQHENTYGTKDWYAEFGAYRMWGSTAPIAICRAALLTLTG